MNQKGGVGKSTSTVNISAALAAMGKRVCVIDIDPQAHATQHLGLELGYDAKSLYDVMKGKSKIAEVRRQVGENLWLIPAHLNMVAAEMELVSSIGRDFILQHKLAEDDFPLDYLFIDCPPSLGVYSINALVAVQEVFVPILPHYLALHGLMSFVDSLEVIGQLNKSLRLSGIIVCQIDNTNLAKEVVQDIADFLSHRDKLPAICRDAVVFGTKIRRNVQLAEAPSHGKPIFDYDPNSPGAEDYRNLAAEIAEKFG